VPDRLGLLEHRLVILEIFFGVVDDEGRVSRIGLSPVIVSALVQEKAGQVEVLMVSRDSIELA
jgi:hypothetical protein